MVFSAVQMSWLSAEQAWAISEEQWAELDTEQRHAVGLARYEGDVLLELRGVSLKKTLGGSNVFLITSFIMRLSCLLDEMFVSVYLLYKLFAFTGFYEV